MTTVEQRFKLGMKEPGYDPRALRFGDYVTRAGGIVVPSGNIGNYSLIPHGGWDMLGNDEYGDCLPAGQGHFVMLTSAQGHHPVQVVTSETLADYFAMNSVAPGQPGSSSDQGTDPRVGLSYHRNTGMIAEGGVRHKLYAYTEMEVGNLNEVDAAVYLFGAAGIGLNLPMSAQDQFPSGYWRVVAGSPIEGGHWIIVVGKWHGYYEVISWGKRIHVTPQFLTKYMVYGAAMFTEDMLNAAGLSPQGFNAAQLIADLPVVPTL